MIRPVGSSFEYEDATILWTSDADRSRRISVKKPDERDYTYTVYVDGAQQEQKELKETGGN